MIRLSFASIGRAVVAYLAVGVALFLPVNYLGHRRDNDTRGFRERMLAWVRSDLGAAAVGFALSVVLWPVTVREYFR